MVFIMGSISMYSQVTADISDSIMDRPITDPRIKSKFTAYIDNLNTMVPIMG
jgi:hypothetical protein